MTSETILKPIAVLFDKVPMSGPLFTSDAEPYALLESDIPFIKDGPYHGLVQLKKGPKTFMLVTTKERIVREFEKANEGALGHDMALHPVHFLDADKMLADLPESLRTKAEQNLKRFMKNASLWRMSL